MMNTVKRIVSIDVTRGIVMIIMALDHVRDLIHTVSITQSPTDLSTTTPLLFFTRWITYLCAPIFVFLSGTSAYLSFKRKNDLAESRKFLFKRGCVLILIELIVVNFVIFFDPGYHLILFEVIATIGTGFILLSLLLRLAPKTIFMIGLVIIFGHGLLALLPITPGSPSANILSPFFTISPIPLFKDHIFLVAYPPIPWFGIMLAGFGAGRIFELGQARRRKILLSSGLISLALFCIIRFVNIYGDPATWSSQTSAVYTFLSFMNVSKYPPSLLFCLVTLGIMLLILYLADNKNSKATEVARVYGNAPLFYFVVHFFLIHIILLIVLYCQGFSWNDLDFASGTYGRPKAMRSGLPLWAVYLTWIFVIAVLYKPCKWYGNFKRTHPDKKWLRYL